MKDVVIVDEVIYKLEQELTEAQKAAYKELHECFLRELSRYNEPEQCGSDIHYSEWHEPAPKKIPFKQAQVRQSFRQSMRSVNRNR